MFWYVLLSITALVLSDLVQDTLPPHSPFLAHFHLLWPLLWNLIGTGTRDCWQMEQKLPEYQVELPGYRGMVLLEPMRCHVNLIVGCLLLPC